MQVALRTSAKDGDLVIHVSGSLGRDGVPLLEDALTSARSSVVIDLAEMRAASAEGLAALRALRAGGHRLRNASPYLTLRLQENDEIEPSPDRQVPGDDEARWEEGEKT